MTKKSLTPRGIKKIALFWGIVLALFSKASFVLALEISYPKILGLSINSSSGLPEYICYFFGLIMNLGFLVAVVSIAFGGISYLVSYGMGKFTDEGKEWIKAGILGMLIIVCASLITYTINPSLTKCKVGILSVIPLYVDPTPIMDPSKEVVTYKEIPIGTLTENLLTRTMGCYEFNQNGDPVDFATVDSSTNRLVSDSNVAYSSPQYFIPTYSDHDRVDCLLQLTDGAQKKAQLIANLSNEINKLMNSCDCTLYGNCGNDCNKDGNGCNPPPADCPAYSDYKCTGTCVGAFCQQLKGNDCCPTDAKDSETGASLGISVKTQIEHGPIKITTNVSGADGKCSSSSDCPATEICNPLDKACIGIGSGSRQNCSANIPCPSTEMCIANTCVGLVGGSGKDCSAGKTCPDKEICNAFNNKCTKLDIIDHKDCNTKTVTNGLDEFRCESNPAFGIKLKTEGCSGIPALVETPITVGGKTVTIIDQGKWKKLNLLQQLTYFKEKIPEIKNAIQQDKNKLSSAKPVINSCYLATPYIELLKNSEGTDQTKKVILVQKTFSGVDSSKYCVGFNYNNSSCLKTCNDLCPDASPGALSLYKNSKTDNDIKNAYNNRPCTSNYPTFKDCIGSCQNSCLNDCAQKYQTCSVDYNTCRNQCNNNSQCVLNNAGNCLFSADGFQKCASNASDQENNTYCINRAYFCKNGSDEYAGYPDCAIPSSAGCTSFVDKTSCESSAGCYWNVADKTCQQNYSASYFYDNPNSQKCPKPYDPTKKCPDETTKCPAASSCPDCPCDQIKDRALSFSVPVVSSPGTYTALTKKVSANEIVGPQCNEYLYNDDPLTFYCENNWWKSGSESRKTLGSGPLGKDYIIDLGRGGEIPVGQMVNDAENWADSLITKISSIISNINSVISKAKQAGDAYKTSPIQNYCKCNAQYINSLPICDTGCNYSGPRQRRVPTYDDTGKQIGTHLETYCYCSFQSCHGKPCSQVSTYLSQVWGFYGNLKNTFIDFYVTMMTEPRSDIIKELAYSRQKTNACSLISSAYGVDTKMLSCTRVKDEIISPVNSGNVIFKDKTVNVGCFGQELGKTAIGKTATNNLIDNWFCSQLQSKDSILESEGYNFNY